MATAVLLGLLTIAFVCSEARVHFQHDVRSHGNQEEEEGGFHLRASGKMADILDLDSLYNTVTMGRDGRLRLSSPNTEKLLGLVPDRRLVFSRNLRRLSQNGTIESSPLLARVRDAEVINVHTVAVSLAPVSGIEVLDEGEITFQYSPPPAVRGRSSHRSKRYVINTLTDALSAIDWKLNDTRETITIGCEPIGKDVVLTKMPGENDTKISIVDSQTTANVKLQGSFEARFGKADGVEGRFLIGSTPRHVIRRLPIARPDGLPTFDLEVAYSSATYLEIKATAEGPLHYRGSYMASGDYSIESLRPKDAAPSTRMTTGQWHVTSSTASGSSDSPFLITMGLYHQVNIETVVNWGTSEITIFMLPTHTTSLKPTVLLQSTEEKYERCVAADLDVTGEFSINRTTFTAELFHTSIWDVVLRQADENKKTLLHSPLLLQCSANCPAMDSPPTQELSACGLPGRKISRGDAEFQRLTVVAGNLVTFTGEEADTATWCGSPERKCKSCDAWDANPCADRVMSPTTAKHLTSLAHLVRADWSNCQIEVTESWDEATSEFPLGRHGNHSLHYEGRALQLHLVTKGDNNSSISVSGDQLKRLRQLAYCAGFAHAQSASGFLDVCSGSNQFEITRQRRSASHNAVSSAASGDRATFEEFMNNLKVSASRSGSTPDIAVGDSYPPRRHLVQVLGPAPTSKEEKETVYQYTYDDFKFEAEGPAGASCGEETRPCHVTCDHVDSAEVWDWCMTRVFTPRMAARLRRLSQLALQSGNGVSKLVVQKTLISQGDQDVTRLLALGRGAAVSLGAGSSMDGKTLASLAAQAGFDYIRRPRDAMVEVFVRRQEGYRGRIIIFPLSNMIPVSRVSDEYSLPGPFLTPGRFGRSSMSGSAKWADEDDVHPLFDGHDRTLHLSEHYKIDSFAHPDFRYFRLSPQLVTCLELSADALGGAAVVLQEWGYRPAPANRINLESRHPQERFAFQIGSAAVLQPPTVKGRKQTLTKMGESLITSCTPYLLRLNMMLGLGCHGDKLYVDIREKTLQEVEAGKFVHIWDVNNPSLLRELSDMAHQMEEGGPVIKPINEDRICKQPEFGEKNAYFTFPVGLFCLPGSGKFCSDTAKHRQDVARELSQGLKAAMGSGTSQYDIEAAVRKCVVDNCGGCPGAGNQWKAKLHGCVALVQFYVSRMRSPFGDITDRAAFFNTHNVESGVHHMACREGSTCVEDAQIHSLAIRALDSKYKPDAQKSQEEKVFSAHGNPSPLLEVIQQEMAFRARGKVKVNIETEADVSVLRDTLKVLMIYNKNVNHVEFHYPNDEVKDHVIPKIQRHLENWARRTCPKWSRFAAAPFSSHVTEPSRHKRSVERSRERNRAKRALRDWEIDWIMRI